MRKQVFLFGLLMAVCIVLLKYFEYNFLIKSFSEEAYIGVIAASFTLLGIWVSSKLFNKGNPKKNTLQINEENNHQLKLSAREKEVLLAIADGLSNKEIGEKLFLSESTIKSHSTNLFAKLNVSRRTQAVQKARELGLLS